MHKKRQKRFSSLSERQRRRIINENVTTSIPLTDITSPVSDSDSDNGIDNESISRQSVLMSTSSSSSSNLHSENPDSNMETALNIDIMENQLDTQSNMSECDSWEYRYSSSNMSDISSLDFENDDEDYFYNPDEARKQECLEDVRNLILEHNIDHVTANHILVLMNKYTDFQLPTNPRTVLRTPRTTEVWQINGGEYYHFGVGPAIKKIINDIKKNLLVYTNNIDLLVNIDGAPLHNSTTKGIWPIQVSTNISNTVYAVGIFYGPGKPRDVDEFLKMFVNEIKDLIKDGLQYLSEIFTISIKALICDAPAKSMILNTKGHSGYSSCPTCEIVGSRVNNVTCFPNGIGKILRTDDDFKNLMYIGSYQRGQTLLNEIPNLGLVTNVPRDYMHLVCLGITRKLIFLWKYGPPNIRLENDQLQTISDSLIRLSKHMPTDFARKPRALKYVKYWKATEFRRFLLYDGPIILKNILSPEKYDNFIKLHVAIRILCDRDKITKVEYINLARELLQDFVQSFEIIYSARYVSYNVHNLLHLASDAERYGSLDNFSCFRFESFLFFLKKLLRKHNQELSQIVKRCKELDEASMNVIKKKKEYINEQYLNVHNDGPARNLMGIQYKTYKTKDYTIKCKDKRNNCVMLNNNTAIRCLNFIQSEGEMYVIGKQFNYTAEIFSNPVQSSDIGCFIADESPELNTWNCNEITTKACVIPTQERFAVIPLIHAD